MSEDETAGVGPRVWTIEEILDELSRYEGLYPRAAIEAALARREEILPRLIEAVEQAADHPEEFADSSLPLHAVMILGHFADPAAHAALLRLANMPDPYSLLGDALTEYMAMILYRTAGGSLDGIRSLIENEDADESARSAGMGALTYAVGGDQLPREEALAYFAARLADETAEPVILAMIVSAMLDLYPDEWLPVIEAVYASERADAGYIDLDDVHRRMEQGPEAAQKRLLDEMARYDMDDLHAALEHWAMYGDGLDEGEAAGTLAELEAMAARTAARRRERAQEAKRKKKRKQEKAARKKSRKR